MSGLETLPDETLLRRLGELDPASDEFLAAVGEASARRLQPAYEQLVGLFKCSTGYDYELVELVTSFWGRPVPAEAWPQLAFAYSDPLVAALLRQSQRLGADVIADVAQHVESVHEAYIINPLLRGLMTVEPLDPDRIELLLLRWGTDARLDPTTRRSLFERLAALPRTPAIEGFFVEFLATDDSSYPDLVAIANQALQRK